MAETTQETRKLHYGSKDYNLDAVIEGLGRNIDGYVRSLGLNQKDSEKVYSSIQDAIARLESGDIDSVSSSGVLHSNSDYTNNPLDKHFLGIKTGTGIDPNGLAAKYVWEFLKNAPSENQSSISTTKTKFTGNGLDQAFMNYYFGGNAPDPTSDTYKTVWLNLDMPDSNGKRSRTNRLLAYSKLIDNYINDPSLESYDYTGSAHKDITDYKTKLAAASTAAKNGDYDAFVRAYAAASGNMTNLPALFTDAENLETSSSTSLTLDVLTNHLNDYKELLKQAGYTDATLIELMVQAERKKYLDQLDYNRLQILENQDWNNQVAQYTGLGGTTIGFTPWSEEDLKYYFGNPSLDEKQGTQGLFSHYNVDEVFNKFINGYNLTNDEYKAVRAKVKAEISTGDSTALASLGSGRYLLKDSISSDGTAWIYDDTQNKFIRMAYGKDSNYDNALKTLWQNNRYKIFSQYTPTLQTQSVIGQGTATSLKKGGKINYLAELNKLKNGGIIKALNGTLLALMANDNMLQGYEDLMQQEMTARGATRDQVIAGHAKNKIWGDGTDSKMEQEKGVNTSDYTHLITALTDLASIPVSYVPGGNAVAAAMGVGTTIADAVADYNDDSMTSGEKWLNFFSNLLFTGATLVGAGAAKFSKTAAVIVKTLPAVLTAYGAASMVSDPDFQKAIGKLEKGKFTDLTSNDLKIMGKALHVITGAHNVTKSTAGTLGNHWQTSEQTHFADTKNWLGKHVLSPWGNNTSVISGGLSKITGMSNAFKANKLAELKYIKSGGFLRGDASNTSTFGERLLGKDGKAYNIEDEAIPILEKAYTDASRKGTDVNAAMREAYIKFRASKGNPISTEDVKALELPEFNNINEVRNFFLDASGNNKTKLTIGTGADAKTYTGTNEQITALRKAYGEAYKAALEGKDPKTATPEELTKANTEGMKALTELWHKTFDVSGKYEGPLFAFDENKYGRLNLKKYFGTENLGAKSTDNRLTRTAYSFDTNTEAGRRNANLLEVMRRLTGRNKTFASDIEYNQGLTNFGLFLKSNDKLGLTPYYNQVAEDAREETNKAHLLYLDELDNTREPGFGEHIEYLTKPASLNVASENLVNYKKGYDFLKSYGFTDELISKFLLGKISLQITDTNGEPYDITLPFFRKNFNFKKGGKLGQLKSLKQGGRMIIKALPGTHVTGVGNADNSTWSSTVGDLTWAELLKRLEQNPEYYLKVNLAQDEHSALRNTANGKWSKESAYVGTDNAIKDYQDKYQAGDWNNTAIKLNYKTRYDFSGGNGSTRTSQDAPETWTSDNYYSQITDDRRLLGRDDDYDETSLKTKNEQLAKHNLELYKGDDGYYRLKKKDGSTTTDSGTKQGVGTSGLTHPTDVSHSTFKTDALKSLKGIIDTADARELLNVNLANWQANNSYNKLKDLKSPLISHTDLHKQVMDDPSGEALKLDKLAQETLSRYGNFSKNFVNGDDAIRYMLAGTDSANDVHAKADLLRNSNVEKTSDAAWEQMAKNVKLKDEDKNTNATTLSASENLKKTLDASKDLEIISNWMKYNSNQIYKDQTNRQNLLYAITYGMKKAYNAYMYPYIMKIRNTVSGTKEYNDAIKEYLNKLQEWNTKELPKWDYQLYALRGINISPYIALTNVTPYTIDYSGLSLKKGGKLDKLESLKSGGKSDDGPVKTRSKDADRFHKRNVDVEKNNLKHKDRLGKLTEMYAKRAMGKK